VKVSCPSKSDQDIHGLDFMRRFKVRITDLTLVVVQYIEIKRMTLYESIEGLIMQKDIF
jgi:hypothetical protein